MNRHKSKLSIGHIELRVIASNLLINLSGALNVHGIRHLAKDLAPCMLKASARKAKNLGGKAQASEE